ncbi:MAG: hypothetical protein HC889_13885 [Synechococcaceae cyanobacterium SM1_2_3]|nr:hypothetical protein [Synechococcaceae cyanobacterium SM1_2_3]
MPAFFPVPDAFSTFTLISFSYLPNRSYRDWRCLFEKVAWLLLKNSRTHFESGLLNHRHSGRRNFHVLSAVTHVSFKLLIALGLFSSLSIAQAATYTVTNLNDNGPGSLRQAMLDSLSILTSADNTIVFQSGLSGTITLSSSIRFIGQNKSLTINGPGANVLAISGNRLTEIFNFSDARSTITVNGFTIKDGSSIGFGGGIHSYGALTVTNCVLSGNSSGNGGGISNHGTLTVSNSTLSGNSAAWGGGIYNSGTLTVRNSIYQRPRILSATRKSCYR